MKFSLKSWLISICVVGAAVGGMARLLIENPEMFLAIIRIGSTVGAFLLATATIIWIGFRGAPRGRGLVLWGCTLLLTPVLAHLALATLLPSGRPLQLLSTQRLITKRLPSQFNEPWVWQELERRLKANELTKQEVDDALIELTAHMKKAKPGGWNEPMPWQSTFLRPAVQKRMVSDEVFIALCDAFFGPSPTVKVTTPSLNADDKQLDLRIEHGTNWTHNSGLEIDLVWDVKQIRFDGKPVKVGNYHNPFGWDAMMTIESDLTPGEHQLEIELNCAFVDLPRLTGVNRNNLTADQWPPTRKRWTVTKTIAVHVEKSADVQKAEE